MKRLLPAIFIIASTFGCTKPIDIPVLKTPYSTLVYTANYSGISSNNTFVYFSVDFPAFNSSKGTLTSWRLTLNRKVSGTLTITNSLSVINDSAIVIDRYTLLQIGDTSITLPDQIVNSIKHILPPNQTLIVPIEVKVDDEINSSNLTPVLRSSDEVLTWNFTDLVDAFKPNSINSYNLTDSIALTLTYTYKR